MINIFFDPLQQKWSHRHEGKTYLWGKDRNVLSYAPFSPALSFNVMRKGRRIGPIVGIITSSKGTTFAGNRETFRRIHYALQERGGIAFVFTPYDTKRHYVKGNLYNTETHRWVKTNMPYPDVVYNRVPFRKEEKAGTIQSVLRRLNSLKVPYFNGSFLDKWEMFECLHPDSDIAGYLPDTRLASRNSLAKALYSWNELYLKPKAGQKGDGMIYVELTADETIFCQSHEQANRYESFKAFWEVVRLGLEKNPYLIQKKIHLARHHGKPYDFRLLMQKVSGTWRLTGAGARLAGKDAITTHVPKGGELLSLEQIQPPVDLELLTTICKQAAQRLEEQFAPLDELSFDIGRDRNGNHWLFEANAKPMIFDEPEIEALRMKRLTDIFYEKSSF
ncbi:MAG TPA: YheC/YheD family protein [Bacillales bacterium]